MIPSANNDTIHKLAMLLNVSNPEVGRPIMKGLLTTQLLERAYNHLSGADQIEALRQETINNIATHIKEHPNAEPNEIQNMVVQEINAFKLKLQQI